MSAPSKWSLGGEAPKPAHFEEAEQPEDAEGTENAQSTDKGQSRPQRTRKK